MRSPRKVLQEKIRDLTRPEGERFVDIAAQARVYRRGPDGTAQPAEWLPRIFGGKFDRLVGRYVGPPDPANIAEVKIHPGQVPIVNAIGSDRWHVLSLGAQGGGKTEGNVSVAVLLSAWRCHSLAGMVAPVDSGKLILWTKFLNRVEALGWLDGEPRLKSSEVQLKNGTILQFRSTKKQSKSAKSPIAGLDWHWAVADEEAYMDGDELREIQARGRINPKYQIFSSATNEPIHAFQMRLVAYDADARSLVARYAGPDNCFTSLEFWDAWKQKLSPEDYDRFINCKDVPRDGRVFHSFDYKGNTAALPPASLDITAKLTYDRYKVPYQYVIGWDPGVIASASVVLKAFAGQGADERNWYALDEITTSNATTEQHAHDLVKWLMTRGIRLDSVLVLGDPHENKDTDRSDYHQMRAAGLTVARSNQGVQIERKHRISMTNALLKDASQRRRLFLAAGDLGPPRAQKLAECLGQLMYRPNGEIDYEHKTWRNLAHWGDALGYGLFPFEKLRGSYKPRTEANANQSPGMRRHMGH
jgi:hypothetical protein